METKQILLIVLVLVVFVGVEMAAFAFRKSCQKRMVKLLTEGDYAGFDAYCGKGLVKAAVPPHAAKMMKLNVLLQGGNERELQATFEDLESMQMNDQARCDLAIRGFYHYLPLLDKKKCRKYVDIIQETCKDESMKQLVQRFYEVRIEKRDDLLPTLLEELEGMEAAARFNNEYLISEIYQNQGKKAEAKRYLKLSQAHQKEYFSQAAQAADQGKG